MTWVVLGKGLFGWNLSRVLATLRQPHVSLGRKDLDLLAPDIERFARTLRRGDVVVNAAGMTDVDACEDRPDDAMRANADAPAALAKAAVATGARFAHLSSDAVLDVTNAYARSKAEGERRVGAAAPDALILRVSTTFGPHPTKGDFVQWVLAKLRAGEPFDVLADMVSSPTYAPDAARALVALVLAERAGVQQVVNSAPISRHAFALKIQDAWNVPGEIRPARLADFKGFRAPRPRDTGMASTIEDVHPTMPLDACLADYRDDPWCWRR